jgi:hypothetical protein
MSGASPEWLQVLQAVSYTTGGLSLALAALAFWFGGFRVSMNALVDPQGQVVLIVGNKGRLGGAILQCTLVNFQAPTDLLGNYEIFSECRELPLGSSPIFVAASGGQIFTFQDRVPSELRGCVAVSVYLAGQRSRLLRPEPLPGTFGNLPGESLGDGSDAPAPNS